MTSVRQLYALQELDLVLDRLRSQQNQAKQELKSEVSVENLETALTGEAERLQEVALQQRDNQIETDGHRERSQTLETQLYDGSMTNPRKSLRVGVPACCLPRNKIEAEMDEVLVYFEILVRLRWK